MSAAGSAPPDDPQALETEIERTRGELGDTLAALLAKADVKAQARTQATRALRRTLAAARLARERMSWQRAKASAMFRETAPDPMQEAAKRAAHAARRRKVPVAAAGLAAVLAGWIILRRRRR
jgi:hypothetical protein